MCYTVASFVYFCSWYLLDLPPWWRKHEKLFILLTSRSLMALEFSRHCISALYTVSEIVCEKKRKVHRKSSKSQQRSLSLSEMWILCTFFRKKLTGCQKVIIFEVVSKVIPIFEFSLRFYRRWVINKCPFFSTLT